MKKIFILYIFIFPSSALLGQELFLDALVTEDSIQFRWAPTTLDGFRQGLASGYVLECLPWNGEKYSPIDTIKPATAIDAELILNEHPNDDAAGVAAYYLYHEETPTQAGSSNFMDGAKSYNNEMFNFNLVVTAADLSTYAAQILGLKYEMPNPAKGKKAIYRVRTLGEGKLDTANYLFSTELSYFPLIEGIELDQKGRIIWLSWDNQYYQKFYTAFDIYRSTTRNGVYEKMTNAPVFQSDTDANSVMYKDSVQIGRSYFYKVQGRTAFGTKGAMSEAKEIYVVDQVVNYKAIDLHARGNHNSIVVRWKPEVGTGIKQVKLLKANAYAGPYEEIAVGQVSSLSDQIEDHNIGEKRVNYYRVAAQNNDGFWYHSNPVRAVYEDEVPPAIPINLIGAVDSTGVCYIHWQANEEEDLKGYRVYKSNRRDGTYYHAHDLLNYTNTFIDTVGIQYLTEEIYYKVVAVDYDNNHSEYSELLKVKRPDLVAPVASQIYKYEVVDQGLKLLIHNSPSKDVEKCLLQKYTKDSTEVIDLEIDKDQSFYIDQNFEEGVVTHYRINTFDDAGNMSSSRPVVVRSRNRNSSLSKVEAKYAEGQLELQWSTSEDEAGQVVFYVQPNETDEFIYLSKLPAEQKSVALQWTNRGRYKVACVLLSDSGKRYPPIFSNSISVE